MKMIGICLTASLLLAQQGMYAQEKFDRELHSSYRRFITNQRMPKSREHVKTDTVVLLIQEKKREPLIWNEAESGRHPAPHRSDRHRFLRKREE